MLCWLQKRTQVKLARGLNFWYEKVSWVTQAESKANGRRPYYEDEEPTVVRAKESYSELTNWKIKVPRGELRPKQRRIDKKALEYFERKEFRRIRQSHTLKWHSKLQKRATG